MYGLLCSNKYQAQCSNLPSLLVSLSVVDPVGRVGLSHTCHIPHHIRSHTQCASYEPNLGNSRPPVSKDPWARGRRKAALCADQCRNYSLFRSFCLLAVLNNSTVSIPHILLVPEGTVPCFPFDSSRLLPSVLANVCSGLMER